MGRRLLVVDDDADIRELLSTQLSAIGYEVTTAADGVEALDLANRDRPDLMIVDVMMPGLDGFQLVQTILDQPFTSDIPCVFLTAKDEVPDRVKGLRLGAYDYVTKPFSMNELVARIEGIMARKDLGVSALSHDAVVAGKLGEVTLPGVVQTVEDSRLSGVLHLSWGGLEGEIAFNEGRMVGAKVGEQKGEEALVEALRQPGGTFNFERCEAPEGKPMGESNIAVFIRAMKRIDEANADAT